MSGVEACLFVLKIILPPRNYGIDEEFEILALEVKGSDPK
jgi:hypothetical protein